MSVVVPTIYDFHVAGPEALDVSVNPSADALRQWWDRAKVYAEAMRDLNRVTILGFDPERKVYWLSSVEESR